MAGSRLDRIGTIYSRITGLLKTEAVKYNDRPIWYDIYRIFPPKYEPHFDRKPEITTPIPDLFYEEDIERAKRGKMRGRQKQPEFENKLDLSEMEPARRRIAKPKLITEESLALLFKEAKEKQDLENLDNKDKEKLDKSK